MNATPSISIFLVEIFFLRPVIWPLCIFFASQKFSNLRSVKSFFCEKDFFGFFFTVTKFVLKIFLRIPYIQKVRDPTFLSPKFDVFFYFFKKILLLPPLTYPLRIFFCLRRFCQIIATKKDSKCLLDLFLTAHPKFLTHFFLLIFFFSSKSVWNTSKMAGIHCLWVHASINGWGSSPSSYVSSCLSECSAQVSDLVLNWSRDDELKHGRY